MSTIVNETPEMSEDESIQSIVETSSLVIFDSDGSEASFEAVKRSKQKKPELRIDSDTSSDDGENYEINTFSDDQNISSRTAELSTFSNLSISKSNKETTRSSSTSENESDKVEENNKLLKKIAQDLDFGSGKLSPDDLDESVAVKIKKKRKPVLRIDSDTSSDDENVMPDISTKESELSTLILRESTKESLSFSPTKINRSGKVELLSTAAFDSNSLRAKSTFIRSNNDSSEVKIISSDSINERKSQNVMPHEASRKAYRESIQIIESRSPSPDDYTLDVSSDEEHFKPSHESSAFVTASSDLLEIKENQNPNNAPYGKPAATFKENYNSHTYLGGKIEVTLMEYRRQQEIVQNLCVDKEKSERAVRSVNLNALPDKGQLLLNKLKSLEQQITEHTKKLNNMVVKQVEPPKAVNWYDLQAGIDNVKANTQGRRALQTLNVQKALTLDRLEQLHGSLKTCPSENTEAEPPKGLKVELMPHQKQGMAWLLWREQQKPSGGILADDMGLGKTLTMISLTLKDMQLKGDRDDSESSEDDTNEHRKNHKYPGGTVVICPASVLFQWEAEIKKHVKKGLLSVDCYHGANRENKAKRLAKYDFVLTTYALVMGDHGRNGPLFNIKWRRIVLDEAHQIRNYKSQTSVAVCSLAAKSRWALTGTPVHNKELDVYALLKFLRCSPFDDLTVWKRWVANKATGGQDRLNTVISSLILRRTKQQLAEKKILNLPEKSWEIIYITLSKEEMEVYQKVLIFSRTLFAQFLHQRAERDNNDYVPQLPNDPNGAYFQMHKRLIKLNKVKKLKQHDILVLLLRLRQICCHPSLITGMLQSEDQVDEFEGQEEFNILEQLNNLNLNEPEEQNPRDGRLSLGGPEVGLAEASRNMLNPANPVFSENLQSGKINAIMKILNNISQKGDKCIIVSQWTKFLNLVSIPLKKEGRSFFLLDGSVPVNKRMEIVENINNPSHKVQILLLSLTAGGVGLNLIGANHLILSDLHWNPQLEMQAQDRIFRVGQKKTVQIYKLITNDSIEQRIYSIQTKKLSMAEEIISGAKIEERNKLSIDDLKMLFDM